MENRPVPLVVGAGLSGLTAAWHVAAAGGGVHVVDAEPGPGGLMQSRQRPEGLVETAARGFIWTDKTAALFAAAGVAPQFADEQSKRRYIFRGGRPRRWPLGLAETASLAAHFGGSWVTRRTKPQGDESVAVWSRRVLGRGATAWLLAPAMQGIYASPLEDLSARAIFGGQRLRGRLAAPPQGMTELMDKLRAGLIARGATFSFGAPVSELAPGRPTIVCTNAPSAAGLIAPHAPQLASAIANVRMTSLLSVTAFYPPQESDVRGFGILFPRTAGVTALGVLFNADMFAGRSTVRSETWIYGDLSADALRKVEGTLPETLRADRQVLTSRDDIPIAVYPTSRIERLPVYDTAVLAVASRLDELPPWLALAGNYLGKLGVSALVEIAERAATRVLSGPSRR